MRILAVILALVFTQQPGPSSVDGVVVKAGTSEPVAKATVELRMLGDNPGAAAVMTTGSDGRFSFAGIPSGRYRVQVSRSGYLNSSAASSRELALQGGASSRNVRLSLTETGAISGRVFDGSGDPIANVAVQALGYIWEDGQRKLDEVKTTDTNDRGEFRLFWLPPGRYYLRATTDSRLSGAFRMQRGGDGKFVIEAETLFIGGRGPGTPAGRYAPVYYPGTADPQGASAVDVGSGSDVGGVDFVMVRATTRNVRATVIDGTTGLPVPNPSATLVPRNGSGIGNGFFVPSSNENVVEARDVLPGSYYLVATARINAGNDSFWVRGGRTPVDVADKDIDGVTVVVQSPADLPGRVTVEGAQALTEETHPVVTLLNALSGAAARPNLYAQFSDNRQFVIDGVHEGEYRVQLSDFPRGTYLKSLRFGGAEVTDGIIHVDPRARSGLEVVLGANGGAVSGFVGSSVAAGIAREPLAGATVAVIPSGANRDRPDLYKGTKADEQGRFHIEGIAPGDYLLFSWEVIDEALWRDPEFIRRNERLGRLVRITDSGQENAELTALPIQ